MIASRGGSSFPWKVGQFSDGIYTHVTPDDQSGAEEHAEEGHKHDLWCVRLHALVACCGAGPHSVGVSGEQCGTQAVSPPHPAGFLGSIGGLMKEMTCAGRRLSFGPR